VGAQPIKSADVGNGLLPERATPARVILPSSESPLEGEHLLKLFGAQGEQFGPQPTVFIFSS
jgi:hypothetical protein